VIVNWTDLLVRATIGIMSASDAAPLPRLGEVFFDVRGDSRSMRLSWYADTGVAVFSVWSGGRCTGTFRLPIDDLPRMIEILQRGPERRRRPAPDGGRPERADRGRSRNEPGYYGEGDYSDGDDGDGIFGDDDGDHDGRGHDGRGLDGGGHNDAGYEPGADEHRAGHGAYDQGGYDQGAPDRGGYGQGAPDRGGYGQGAPDRGGYDQSARDLPAHDRGGYDQGGYDQGGYDQGGYDQSRHSDAGYGPPDHSQGGFRRDGYAAEGYGIGQQGPDGYGADAFGTDAFGTDARRPDGYGADDRLTASVRPDGGHRAAGAADSAGYPDVPGYSGATLGEASRPGASRSDVPAGSDWRAPDDYHPGGYQPDGYQPGEYHPDGYQPASYQGDGYQTREYQADGYQTSAYQLDPAEHAAGPESDLAGYGQERFVPPYVQTRSDAYPNDNPAPARARRDGGTRPAYPADHGGVSDERDAYARPPRSGPGYFEGSEDRLAADTPVSARYSAGGRGN